MRKSNLKSRLVFLGSIVFLGVFLSFNTPKTSHAQPPPPPTKPEQTPIDGGLMLLAAAGGGYAIKKLRSRNSQH